MYVGKTINLRHRINEHFSSSGHLDKECYLKTCVIKYTELSNESDMDSCEKYCIVLYKPKYNTVHKGNDELLKLEFDNLIWSIYDGCDKLPSIGYTDQAKYIKSLESIIADGKVPEKTVTFTYQQVKDIIGVCKDESLIFTSKLYDIHYDLFIHYDVFYKNGEMVFKDLLSNSKIEQGMYSYEDNSKYCLGELYNVYMPFLISNNDSLAIQGYIEVLNQKIKEEKKLLHMYKENMNKKCEIEGCDEVWHKEAMINNYYRSLEALVSLYDEVEHYRLLLKKG